MFFKTLREIFRDETGATAIEYGLIAGLVSVAAITALTSMGTTLDRLFDYVNTILNTVMPAAGG